MPGGGRHPAGRRVSRRRPEGIRRRDTSPSMAPAAAGPAMVKPRFTMPGGGRHPAGRRVSRRRPGGIRRRERAIEVRKGSSGRPVPREPGSGSKRRQDAEAQRTGRERMPRWHPRTSGDGARAAPSGIAAHDPIAYAIGLPDAASVRRRGTGSPEPQPHRPLVARRTLAEVSWGVLSWFGGRAGSVPAISLPPRVPEWPPPSTPGPCCARWP
jgi:hypothetical protein